jgi:hypothetical protein
MRTPIDAAEGVTVLPPFERGARGDFVQPDVNPPLSPIQPEQ